MLVSQSVGRRAVLGLAVVVALGGCARKAPPARPPTMIEPPRPAPVERTRILKLDACGFVSSAKVSCRVTAQVFCGALPCGSEPGTGATVMLRVWEGTVLEGPSSIGGTIVFDVASSMVLPPHADGAWAHASIRGETGSLEVQPAAEPFAGSIAQAATFEQLDRFRARFGDTAAWATLRPRYDELVAAEQVRQAVQDEERAAREREAAARSHTERVEGAQRAWQALKRRQLADVESFVDTVGHDVAPGEAIKALDVLRATRGRELARRFSFKGVALGMTRRELDQVRAIQVCDRRLDGYDFCFVATEPDELSILVVLNEGTVMSINVQYARDMTSNHDAFARRLAEKFGRSTKRDKIVVGEAEGAEVHDRTMFVRGGDRAAITSYSMAANVAGAPDKGAGFELVMDDVARAERLRRKLLAGDRAREAAVERGEAERFKF